MAADVQTKTALMCAQEGDFETLKHIIENSGDINKCDEKGLSPLHHAAYFDEGECAELLLSCLNSDIEKRTNRGCTALHIASVSGSSRVLSQLLKCDVCLLDIQNDYGETALHLACAAGNISTILSLLEAGASPSIIDQWNRTPMQVSFEQGDIDALSIFNNRGFEYVPKKEKPDVIVSQESKAAHHDIIQEFMSKLKTSEGSAVEVEVKGIFKNESINETPVNQQNNIRSTTTSSSSAPTLTRALSKMVEFPGNPTEISMYLKDDSIDPAGKV